jgi:hypothetical protein
MTRLLLTAACAALAATNSLCADTPPPPIDLPPPVVEATTTPDPLRQAGELFKQGNYAEAAKLFSQAVNSRAELTPMQTAAWAYCRVRVAAERMNQAKGDPAVTAAVTAEVDAALKLAPSHAELQRFGKEVLAAAGRSAGGTPAISSPVASGMPSAANGWQVLELDSFRVQYVGERELAEAVAKKAEEHRLAIFSRWSGPPGGAWQPACEIVLHPTATAFAEATKQPAAATGHALVKLENGRAVERRIDLRADDDTLLLDALPRELTHIILADLFPGQAPPRWATEAMAVLAASPTEVERYLRTLPRCARDGELVPVATLLASKDLPGPEQITGFAVESVSLVDFLVRWKKEKAFTTFLRDCQRYGLESALKRQYGVTSPKQLEELWKQNVLGSTRGQ